MPFHSQRQRFQPLQEDERVEGGQGRAGIPQQDGADVGDERRRANGIRDGHAVVAGVRVGDPGVFAALLPIDFSAFSLAVCTAMLSPFLTISIRLNVPTIRF